MTSPNRPRPRWLDEIPPLTNMAPAIFVPVARDLTKTPPVVADDPVSRLEYKLKEVDQMAETVEENSK